MTYQPIPTLITSIHQWLNYAPCALLLTFCMLPANAAEFIPLGTLPGHRESKAFGVSDDGMVVAGESRPNLPGPETERRAFRWTDASGMVSVDTLPTKTSVGFYANGRQPLSGDGTTIVGAVSNAYVSLSTEAFLNTASEGTIGLGGISRAEDVSRDGSVVVGTSDGEAFRWTASGGIQPLGFLPGDQQSNATDVSDTGTTVVGLSWDVQSSSTDVAEIYRWTEATGITSTGLIVPDGSSTRNSNLAVVSGDGSIVSSSGYVSSNENVEAFRWTSDGGAIGLGWLPGTEGPNGSMDSQVRDMTPDGSMIVGRSGSGLDSIPFVWTQTGGMEDFQQVLISSHGLGEALVGWNLGTIQSVSANGQFFAGWAIDNQNPTGQAAAWLVRLDAPWSVAVPEPATALLALVTLAPLAVLRWNRQCLRQ